MQLSRISVGATVRVNGKETLSIDTARPEYSRVKLQYYPEIGVVEVTDHDHEITFVPTANIRSMSTNLKYEPKQDKAASSGTAPKGTKEGRTA